MYRWTILIWPDETKDSRGARRLRTAVREAVTLGRDEAWLALAAWAAVSLAMVLALALGGRAPAAGHLYRATILTVMATAS
jgi:hypothetical protein